MFLIMKSSFVEKFLSVPEDTLFVSRYVFNSPHRVPLDRKTVYLGNKRFVISAFLANQKHQQVCFLSSLRLCVRVQLLECESTV